MIFKKTRKFLKALRFRKWTAQDFRKAGVDTRYASERTEAERTKGAIVFENDVVVNGPYIVALADAIKLKRKLETTEKQLEAARHALSVIEAITFAPGLVFLEEIKRIHKIAQDAYGATK